MAMPSNMLTSLNNTSHPILSEESSVAQVALIARLKALIARHISDHELQHKTRIETMLESLAEEMAGDDPHSSDDEAEAKRCRSKEIRALQLQRGSELTKQSEDKAKMLGRLIKCFTALLDEFTKPEIKYLQENYATEFNLMNSSSDPRLLLQLLQRHWALTFKTKSTPARIAAGLAKAAITATQGLSYLQLLRRNIAMFDISEGDPNQLGYTAFLSAIPPAITAAVDRRYINFPTAEGPCTGFGYLNSLTPEEYAVKCDDEAHLLLEPQKTGVSAAAATKHQTPRPTARVPMLRAKCIPKQRTKIVSARPSLAKPNRLLVPERVHLPLEP